MDAERERRYVEFVQNRMPWMRKVAYLLCQDWHKADDIVQTSITQLYIHWKTAEAAKSVEAYTRTILLHVFLGERRSAWARRVRLQNALPEPTGSVGPDHAARLDLRAALRQLPPRQRATLVLRYYFDLPVADIAEELHCSVGTVKSQTARGLAALRGLLDRHPPATRVHGPTSVRRVIAEPLRGPAQGNGGRTEMAVMAAIEDTRGRAVRKWGR